MYIDAPGDGRRGRVWRMILSLLLLSPAGARGDGRERGGSVMSGCVRTFSAKAPTGATGHLFRSGLMLFVTHHVALMLRVFASHFGMEGLVATQRGRREHWVSYPQFRPHSCRASLRLPLQNRRSRSLHQVGQGRYNVG
ncbi:hypothetical protein C8J57DRAFT_1325271 [Mycena rebaudengoi]|nr:hypothetical protein C8J57DRAFT_1325271 [Mycena rebaudengoi]